MIVCVQIGNSDDKLTQAEWSSFVGEVRRVIESFAAEIHFCGTSDGDQPWQNACWVVSIPSPAVTRFESRISEIRIRYRQDSVAITTGQTRFI